MAGMADLEEKVASCEKELDILKRRLVKANSILQIQVCFSSLVSSELSATGKEKTMSQITLFQSKKEEEGNIITT